MHTRDVLSLRLRCLEILFMVGQPTLINGNQWLISLIFFPTARWSYNTSQVMLIQRCEQHHFFPSQLTLLNMDLFFYLDSYPSRIARGASCWGSMCPAIFLRMMRSPLTDNGSWVSSKIAWRFWLPTPPWSTCWRAYWTDNNKEWWFLGEDFSRFPMVKCFRNQWSFSPQIIHFNRAGFSIIFTIHCGVPLFLETPMWNSLQCSCPLGEENPWKFLMEKVQLREFFRWLFFYRFYQK